ncbi:MAG: hypothetical protein HZA89_17005 [Verrucomicrobia bacterium]|nr:hypothetical protein [Verrucomicrobiota bacterium]
MVLAAVVLIVTGAGVAWLLDTRNEPARRALSSSGPAAPKLERPASSERVLETTRRNLPRKLPPIAETPSPAPAVKTTAPPVEPPPSPPAPPQASPAPRQKEPIQDPLARAALSLVGKDDEAEVIWLAAINNPDLPANERKDLIEDLNEDGFADPRHLTAEDLPLIQKRILLIEELAPDALDEVNAAAFAEAHKDLLQMLARAAQQ